MMQTGPVRALGTMSGTSLDGVDVALVETDGETLAGFGATGYRPYAPEERAVLAQALGRWPGEPGVAEAARVVEAAHRAAMAPFAGAELAGMHGQTLAHEPGGRGTHQAGDGAGLARALGMPVVWDFRSADVAAGGQGAPLAPFFHFACARRAGLGAPVAFLNLGGVGNLTLVDPTRDRPEAEGALLAFDTGPANAPIDDLLRSRCGQPCDRDGALAGGGRIDDAVLTEFLAHPYFRKPPPKSLDRNDFAGLLEAVAGCSDADAAATLTAAVAATVAVGVGLCTRRPARLLVTGGGRRNPVLMRMIAERTGLAAEPVEALGLDGDMLEAQAFAFLAVRVARGLPTSCPGTTGVARPVSGGRISQP
ncbi:anhydro-N-acetylmuramic acid kinase [Rhodovulum sulfidophilum]|uniref:anhydro-N-acetylmuramic acid kinase n=1 Tax=Rhodovulum sulfidophilum TaxID=35806 RepID=UPI001912D0F7|nr:anhydro-N-acetylmuramic acid kinase [Rhodovulum sulfidophilum]MBK5924253.1 anhydro-N-acetylmuramic acid kinase [Rhodovulum sulfidophilum]